MMNFDDITQDGRLWSVRYDGESENALFNCFDKWNNVEWLRDFFIQNQDDLDSYFNVTDVNEAISNTIEDADKLQCLILDLSPDADLEKIFRPLDNRQTAALILDKEKARYSWLRLYAIRLEKGAFIITGGAIKLTATMSERRHTFEELAKMEKVRNFLLDAGVVDKDSFEDYKSSL